MQCFPLTTTNRFRDNYPPSNLQLLVAHLSFEVLKNLDTKKFSSVAKILQNFSRNFDRKIELHLEELGPEELMLKSKSEVATLDGGWRREAYVQHLASLNPVKSCFERLGLKCLLRNLMK